MLLTLFKLWGDGLWSQEAQFKIVMLSLWLAIFGYEYAGLDSLPTILEGLVTDFLFIGSNDYHLKIFLDAFIYGCVPCLMGKRNHLAD